MGLTPLGGLMMGTRSGDIDPSVYDYLCDASGLKVDEVYDILNEKSGLLGLSGVSNDTRDILAAAEKGDARSLLAIRLWARRVADFIGQYYVRLGGADLIIFSAGIGENAPSYRKAVIDDCKEALHLDIDEALNASVIGSEALISTPKSAIKVAVIPTDEEVMIARDCYQALQGTL